MSNSDKLGATPLSGWLVNLPVGWALVIAWLITPGAVLFITRFVEKRPVSLWKSGFASFIPGDYFLGVLFMASVALSSRLPAETGRWYQSSLWHAVVFVGAVVACLLARKYLDEPMGYTRAQMMSPSKLYHDFVLYAGYGYLLFSTAVPAMFLTAWSGNIGWKAVGFGAFVLWLGCLVYDQVFQDSKKLATQAHADYRWR